MARFKQKETKINRKQLRRKENEKKPIQYHKIKFGQTIYFYFRLLQEVRFVFDRQLYITVYSDWF